MPFLPFTVINRVSGKEFIESTILFVKFAQTFVHFLVYWKLFKAKSINHLTVQFNITLKLFFSNKTDKKIKKKLNDPMAQQTSLTATPELFKKSQA